MRYLLCALALFSLPSYGQNPLILLSIDGFAYDYLAKYQPKNILALMKSGASSQGMQPVFPSKTFPNHLTLVTGVYPANHGIVHNKFYHRDLKKRYKLGAGKHNSNWLTATPIWTIAEQQGIKTGVYFWPESEAKINGILPSYYFPYQHNTPNQQRIKQIVQWLNLPKAQRPGLIIGYFSTVDDAGHRYGVNSPELANAIKRLDDLIGVLISNIKQQTSVSPNIILVSDHGMIDISARHSINWAKLLKPFNQLNIVNGQTQLYLYEDDLNRVNDVRSHLIKQNNNGQYQVFIKGEYPKHWHFNQTKPQIPDLIVNAIAPTVFVEKFSYSGQATHGFDPQITEAMKAIFIANGPDIKPGITLPYFQNIHLFPLLAQLLKLPVANSIDGKAAVLADIVIE